MEIKRGAILMIKKDEFLSRYYISCEDFDKTDLEWITLEKIYKDFILRTVELLPLAHA